MLSEIEFTANLAETDGVEEVHYKILVAVKKKKKGKFKNSETMNAEDDIL